MQREEPLADLGLTYAMRHSADTGADVCGLCSEGAGRVRAEVTVRLTSGDWIGAERYAGLDCAAALFTQS